MRNLILLTIVVLVGSSGSQTAFAQPDDIYRTLQTPLYDPNSGAGCSAGGGDGGLVGSNNTERGFNYFLGKGLTAPQSAGIIGNFLRESSMNPRIIQGNPPREGPRPVSGLGYGIAQWTDPGRQANLIQFARDRGTPVGSLGLQLDFAWHEASSGNIIRTLRTIESVEVATRYWMESYERPGVPALEERIALARNVLARYGSNTAPGSSDTSACTEDENGEVTGEYSLPVARRWYTLHPDWFSKPHHDYPAADIPVPTGTRVFSMSAGRVTSAGDLGACGRGVIIDAGGGVIFTYCHGLDGGSVPGARVGDQVSAGQRIMSSDNTGSSTGPHLHLQIRVGSQLRCPQPLLVGIARGNVPNIRSLPTSGCSY